MTRNARRNHAGNRLSGRPHVCEPLEPRLLLSASAPLVEPLAAGDPQPASLAELNPAAAGMDDASSVTPRLARLGDAYTQSFSYRVPNENEGWSYYSTHEGRIALAGRRLRMDDQQSNGTYSLNEAVLHLDLAGQSRVKLIFDHLSRGDEPHALPWHFTGHYNGDGVAVSADGVNWYRVTQLTENFTERVFDLDAVIREAGISYTSDFRIKFQQYDNSYSAYDGREIDAVRVESLPDPGVTPRSAGRSRPYTQSFSYRVPEGRGGWEHFSSNEGRIRLAGRRLRLDDRRNNRTASLNESILHLDLAGKTHVKLTFDHRSLDDERHALPWHFLGHAHGDGVAVSADGANWYRVTNLDGSFTGRTFDLDAVVQRAGISYTSDFRIKFQQYDNHAASSDGREIDSIRVEAEPYVPIRVRAVRRGRPYTQSFSYRVPNRREGWEYYSSQDGRIARAGRQLRMDDSRSDGRTSLNEAVLHLDLAGQNNVKLTFDHRRLRDERHALPWHFTGHHAGDGVSVSADGLHWYRVTNLDGSFTERSFDLDAVLRRAGISYTDDFRIKFQQYDNHPAGDDGREFDTILVEAGSTDFQVDLEMRGLTASQERIFRQAAERWGQIITADIPDAYYRGQRVDDVLIDASAVTIDGSGGILGQAGATHLRWDSYLPYRGIMEFDRADLADLEDRGSLEGVVLHEMAHVMGFGVIWEGLGLLSGTAGSNPRFTGRAATAEYNALFDTNASSVPVEAGGGWGTALSHWRESVFGSELMTGWLNWGTNPLSRVTIAAMADIGYTVNMSAADRYVASTAALTAAADDDAAQAALRAPLAERLPAAMAAERPTALAKPASLPDLAEGAGPSPAAPAEPLVDLLAMAGAHWPETDLSSPGRQAPTRAWPGGSSVAAALTAPAPLDAQAAPSGEPGLRPAVTSALDARPLELTLAPAL